MGANELLILADNENHSHIYPQMADFTFYGGLYRGVRLLLLPPVHFETSFYGASGLAVTCETSFEAPLEASVKAPGRAGLQNTPNGQKGTGIPQGSAMLHFKQLGDGPQRGLHSPLSDSGQRRKRRIGDFSPLPCPQGRTCCFQMPHLWQGVEDPYLYRCIASLVYRNETVDQVETAFGIRSFYVDPEKGLFLKRKAHDAARRG